MAKLSDKEKTLLIADYKTNKFSQRELSQKYNVSLGTVSNLTKSVQATNEQFVHAQMSVLSAYAILPIEEMNAILNTAKDELYNKGLVVNASQLNLVRMTQHLAENKKLEKINVGDGIQHFEEVGLGSSDYKNIQDAIDKAATTLGVVDRFAAKIENTNAQQNNSPTQINIIRDN